jgi:hypothetical protein
MILDTGRGEQSDHGAPSDHVAKLLLVNWFPSQPSSTQDCLMRWKWYFLDQAKARSESQGSYPGRKWDSMSFNTIVPSFLYTHGHMTIGIAEWEKRPNLVHNGLVEYVCVGKKDSSWSKSPPIGRALGVYIDNDNDSILFCVCVTGPTPWATPPVLFLVKDFSEIGSGFKQKSSWCLPPE